MSANGSAIPGDHQMVDEVKGKGKAVDPHDDAMMDDDDEDEEESGPEDVCLIPPSWSHFHL